MQKSSPSRSPRNRNKGTLKNTFYCLACKVVTRSEATEEKKKKKKDLGLSDSGNIKAGTFS